MSKQINFNIGILLLLLPFNVLAAILDQGVSSVASTANTQLNNATNAVTQQANNLVQQTPILQPPGTTQQSPNATTPNLQEQVTNQATQNAMQQAALQGPPLQPSQLQTAENQSANQNAATVPAANNQTQSQPSLQPTPGIPAGQLITAPTELQAHYCPLEIELKKVGNIWTVGNDWKDDNVSIVKQIAGFTGAQWVGVNVGSIICLYRGRNAFDFPIALHYVHSQEVFEPKTQNWSAVVTNYKLCKSNKVKDCPFFVKEEKTVQDAYKEIEYNPSGNNSGSY